MAIWKGPVTLEAVIALGRGTMVEHLGIEFLAVGDDFLKARMPVDHRTLQTFGIMHGGASCVLAETVASVAANYCIEKGMQRAVGVEINTSHVHSAKSGWVIGTAKPLHLGRTTQLWEIPIENEQSKLVSITRLRLAVLDFNR